VCRSLSAVALRPYVALLTVALVATGCASRKHDLARDSISAQAPFSKTFRGSGDAVCWSVKRALLSQGYMLDRSAESGVLTGNRLQGAVETAAKRGMIATTQCFPESPVSCRA
jgi:hypothetical protein